MDGKFTPILTTTFDFSQILGNGKFTENFPLQGKKVILFEILGRKIPFILGGCLFMFVHIIKRTLFALLSCFPFLPSFQLLSPHASRIQRSLSIPLSIHPDDLTSGGISVFAVSIKYFFWVEFHGNLQFWHTFFFYGFPSKSWKRNMPSWIKIHNNIIT